jgi:hypothetical protein
MAILDLPLVLIPHLSPAIGLPPAVPPRRRRTLWLPPAVPSDAPSLIATRTSPILLLCPAADPSRCHSAAPTFPTNPTRPPHRVDPPPQSLLAARTSTLRPGRHASITSSPVATPSTPHLWQNQPKLYRLKYASPH